MSERKRRIAAQKAIELAEKYDRTCDEYRANPGPELKAIRDGIALELATARRAERIEREKHTAKMGEARPKPVEGTSGINQ